MPNGIPKAKAIHTLELVKELVDRFRVGRELESLSPQQLRLLRNYAQIELDRRLSDALNEFQMRNQGSMKPK